MFINCLKLEWLFNYTKHEPLLNPNKGNMKESDNTMRLRDKEQIDTKYKNEQSTSGKRT